MSENTTPPTGHSSPARSPGPHQHQPPPAIQVDASETSLFSRGTGPSQSLGPHSPVPATPTSTLAGAGIPLTSGDPENSVITFVPNAAGSLSSPSPSGAQTGSEAFHAAHAQFRQLRSELRSLRRDASTSLSTVPADHLFQWVQVFDFALDMDGMVAYFKVCGRSTSRVESAIGAWTFNLNELLYDLVVDKASTKLLAMLQDRTIDIIRRHWAILYPLILSHDGSDSGHYEPPHQQASSQRQGSVVSAASSSHGGRPHLPSIVAGTPSLHSSRESWASQTHRSLYQYPIPTSRSLFQHPNRAIGSADLSPLSAGTSSDEHRYGGTATSSSGERVDEADLEGARGRSEQRQVLGRRLSSVLEDQGASHRPSLEESVREFETAFNMHLQDMDNAVTNLPGVVTPAVAVEKLKPVKSRLRLMHKLLDIFLDKVAGPSRSPSPSPIATPVSEGGPSVGSRIPPPPLHPISHSGQPHSPSPWSAPVSGTAAPTGPLEFILPSKSSGKYHVVGPQSLPSPSVQIGRHLAVPTHSHRSTSAAADNHVDEEANAPPSLSSTDLRGLLLSILSSDDPISTSDRETWITLYFNLVGRCEFASVGPPFHSPPPNAPGPSTSAPPPHTIYVGCIHPRHVEMHLPCMDPIPVSIEVNISQLLRRLESIQGSRVADLFSMISQLIHDQGSSSAGGLGSDSQVGGSESGGGNSSDRKGKGRAIDEWANDHQGE